MARTLSLLLGLLFAPALASAATLTIESANPVKGDYPPGETITLTITGDPEGASASGIYGRLLYSPALTETVSASQEPLVTSFGTTTWNQGHLSVSDGASAVFNQIRLGGDSPSNLLIATLTLVVEAPALQYTFEWDTASEGGSLDFFGLTSAPGLTIPEPASAALVAVGLVALSASRRRRAC